MVYLVKPVAFLEPNLWAKDVLALLSKVFDLVTLQGAVLLRQSCLVFLDDLEITLLVPNYLVLFRYLISVILSVYLQTPAENEWANRLLHLNSYDVRAVTWLHLFYSGGFVFFRDFEAQHYFVFIFEKSIELIVENIFLVPKINSFIVDVEVKLLITYQ